MGVTRGRNSGKAGEDGGLELLVGIDVDGAIGGSDGDDGIFPEVETSFRNRLSRFKASHAGVAFLAFVGFFTGGDEAKALGPLKRQIVESELGGIAEMGIPAFARADKEDAVAGVFDDVAAIAEAEGEGFSRSGWLREEDTEAVVAVRTQLLFGETFILEKSERRAVVEGDGVDFEGARQLDKEKLRASREGAELHGSVSVQGIVRANGGFNMVAQGIK